MAYKLLLPLDNVMYESAFVWGVPMEVSRWILAKRKELRKNMHIDAPRQLIPHVTVLYLGKHQGVTLLKIYRLLNRLRHKAVTVVCGECEVFTKDTQVTNVHVALQNIDEIVHLHRLALEKYLSLDMPVQTPYIMGRFKPHISIYDGVQFSIDNYQNISCDLKGQAIILRPAFFYINPKLKSNE